MVVFYSQPGGRIPALGVIRFEFVLGAAILVALVFLRSHLVFANERMNRAAMVFGGALCLSFIGAMQTHTVTDAYPVFIELLKSFCIYLMIIGTVDSKEQLEKFIWVYVFCMLILIGEPFLLSLQGQNFKPGEGGILRLYGVGQFAHPNGLGIHAVTTLVLIYYLFWHYRSVIIKAFLVSFGLVCLRVIMLTGSRSAYLGLIILVVYFFLYSKKKLRFVIACFLLVTVLNTFVPSVYRERFRSLKEVTTVVQADARQPTSIGGRWALVRDAWNVFLEHPIFGCGIDSFWRISHEDKEFGTTGQTHNLLMQILAETGIVGLAAFVFLTTTIWRTLKHSRAILASLHKEDGHIYMLMNAFMVFLLTQLTIGMVAQHSLYSYVWWVISGIAVVSLRITTEQETTLLCLEPSGNAHAPQPVLTSNHGI
jgi:hypothetical protein